MADVGDLELQLLALPLVRPYEGLQVPEGRDTGRLFIAALLVRKILVTLCFCRFL